MGDLASGGVVLFGGAESTPLGPHYFGETLFSQGASWNARDLHRSLDARFVGATTFDSGRQRMFALTWASGVSTVDENDGLGWQSAALRLPPSFSSPAVFDPRSGAVVIVDSSGTTWRWDGQAWSAGSGTEVPPSGFTPHLAYSRRYGVVALLYDNDFGGPTAHYEWNGARWSTSASAYPGRRRFAFAYHPARGRFVIAGGETWDPITSRATYLRDA